MKKEKILWWIVAIISGIALGLALWGIFAFSILVANNPESSAFVIGCFGFFLFANRLIFGFTGITNTAIKVIENREIDKNKLAEKCHHHLQNLNEFSNISLLYMWKGALEPFKYTYFFAFFLIFAFDILFELQILTMTTIAPVIKGFMFGAAIPTLIVWGLELMANFYLNQTLLVQENE